MPRGTQVDLWLCTRLRCQHHATAAPAPRSCLASGTGVGLAFEVAAAVWAGAPLLVLHVRGAPRHDARWPLRACLGTVRWRTSWCRRPAFAPTLSHDVVLSGARATRKSRQRALWHGCLCSCQGCPCLGGSRVPPWLHTDNTRRLRGIDSEPFAAGWRERTPTRARARAATVSGHGTAWPRTRGTMGH